MVVRVLHWHCPGQKTRGEQTLSNSVGDVTISSALIKIIIVKRVGNWAWFFSVKVETRWRARENIRQHRNGEMAVVIVVVISFSLSLSLSLVFSFFLCLPPLDNSLSSLLCCTHLQQAYALKMFSSSFANQRALYFRTSNYRNNKHTHCCHATEPVCCCAAREGRGVRLLNEEGDYHASRFSRAMPSASERERNWREWGRKKRISSIITIQTNRLQSEG